MWKAYDEKLRRTVAIKVLHDTADAARRILAEARAASALNHPHICTIYDVGDADGQRFIVMEHVEGKPLSELIPSDGLPPGSVIRYGTQIADALAHAHGHHIVHRDLKSANVVITPDGRAKVLDFGVAEKLADVSAETVTRTHDAISHAGMLVGTLAYMAPEVLAGEQATPRSDIWALGVLLYEMASGRLPFNGTTQTAVIAAIVKDSPVALPSRASAGLRSVVQRCLQKGPGQRYGHSAAVHAALEALQSGTADRASSTAAVPVAAEATSIVVLPFTNMSADPEQEYFSDGLTDEVIADLSGIRTLRVIARTSAMRFKGTDTNLRTVARELNVRYVLAGSVRRAGANLRVTAQLIDPETDSNIWAHKYAGSIDDVFGIQEEISRKIVDTLRMQLSPEEDKKLAERPFDNVEAFEYYYRAQREIYTFTLAGLDRALELIQDALRLVSDNELLYAAMGGIYRQYVNAALKSDDGYIARAEECAEKVFMLNADSAVGHELLGKIRLTQGRPAEGIRHLRRALDLQPNIVHAWNELHRVYDVVGWHAEARALAARARILDPLSPIIRALPLFNQLLDGHPDVVERDSSEALGLFPGFSMMRWTCAMALIHRAKPREALELLEAAPQGDATIAGRLCVFLQRALEGRPDEAMVAVSPELLARARQIEWWSWWVAECYAFIGEETLAIAWLESAFERGFMNYRYLSARSPVFRKLDRNPAFAELLGRIKTRSEQFEP